MAMNGVDVSPWQDSLNLLNISYDFALIKATEGNYYVSPDCDRQYQEAKQLGKKRATYHFTNFGDPIVEADWFVNNTLGYVRDSIPVLDWEGVHVDRVQDALAWLRRVRDRYGYNPAIYMSEWVENNYDWSPVVAENFGLILAKYSNWELANNANNYDMSNAGQQPNCVHWAFYFMWQWTSRGRLNGYAGNLDCDIAYLTSDEWDKYAGAQTTAPLPQPAPETTTTTTTTVEPVSTATTTTTTESPNPNGIPDTQTTTTTTVEPSPGPEEDTDTPATPAPAPSEAEPTQGPQLWVAVWSVFIAIVKFLQGAQQ